MTKKQLNRLADSRVCEMFAQHDVLTASMFAQVIVYGGNFIGTLRDGYVTIIVVKPDGVYCCRVSGDLTKLSCSTTHES